MTIIVINCYSIHYSGLFPNFIKYISNKNG